MDIENKIKPNTSRIYKNGTIWKSNNCGEAVVIGKVDKISYYYLQFEDGTIIQASTGNIQNGEFSNPNKKSIYGVGFLGVGKWVGYINNKQTKEYCVWFDMIRRCYSEYSLRREPSYKNCKVDERWHNFQDFCEDIKELEGYNEWKSSEGGEYQLDKDIKQQGVENKFYSKDTCMFVSREENMQEMIKRKLKNTYIAIRLKDLREEEFNNQIEFSKIWKLNHKCISDCINNKQKTHRGWSFETKNKKLKEKQNYDKCNCNGN